MSTLHAHANLVLAPEAFWRPDGSEVCSPEACTFTPEESVSGDVAALRCTTCDHRVPVTGGIVELVDPESLDEHKSGELEGNEISLDEETIRHYLGKEDWSSFTRHFIERKIGLLAEWLVADGVEDAAFLGSGTGFEIRPLMRHGFRPTRLFVSDLNRSTLEVARYNVAEAGLGDGVPVTLFTSDLDVVPLKSRDRTLVIYECLHHTPDMHATIERMLAYGYRTIYFVEPTTNWLIRYLARKGLAQRIEYSGVDPDRLDLKRLDELTTRYGYRTKMRTLWEFPDDYYRRVVTKVLRGREISGTERAATAAIDALSYAGSPVRFGNFTVCRLTKS
jgi:hypothetical protein